MIGIPCRELSKASSSLPAEGVRISYIDSVIAAEGDPVLIPLGLSDASLRRIYDSCSSILLTGGEDVDPARYGEVPHEKLGTFSTRRDETEIRLARWAYADRKPLLGVCRGVQVMNVALGGTLFQDIPSQLPKARAHQWEEWEATPHVITPVSGTHIARLFGDAALRVNSLHHQAVKDVAPGLVVNSVADDGVIEGVESPDEDRIFVGVQWHPEVLWQKLDARWIKLFGLLV